MRKRFREQCAKLFVIKDTPHAIALGTAIGIFLGFTPLFGLKTLLALGTAFAVRANKIAAVVGVASHDLVLPFRPALYFLEFDLGYWLLHHSHQWVSGVSAEQLLPRVWLTWEAFGTLGGPMLLGAVLLGAPTSLLIFYLTRSALARRQNRLRVAQ